MRTTVLGAGAWGTALARLLYHGKNQVTLWGHNPAGLEEIGRTHRNERFLPGIEIPKQLILESSLPKAIKTAECVVVAVPSKAFREVTSQLSNYSGVIVSVTKGI